MVGDAGTGMKILAIDTATDTCSAAIWAGDAIAAERREPMARGHAEALMPMVAEVLTAADGVCPNGFADLQMIAVTVGPGAFTGVRIGLAAARAMGLAAKVPVVGLTTLEVVAAAQDSRGLPLLVALETKRSDFYTQLFGPNGAAHSDPAALSPSEIAALLPEGAVALAGDAAGRLAQALGETANEPVILAGPAQPDAGILARLAAVRWAAGPPPTDGPPPRPLYLRPPDVTPPKAPVR
ncbi:MAG: tRNA (adenosine(37)-N6)-threonylcarbamoyltransferase complex dimerization subunit type 1 TsaB [Alphaproteobacteria bacterium]|nr:tRNA (adenosine(37)-N6)-threonylcarbamoyltransferase complex dimerization subunit type 1 TsaB [Alphaproteobacteria bacterium]